LGVKETLRHYRIRVPVSEKIRLTDQLNSSHAEQHVERIIEAIPYAT